MPDRLVPGAPVYPYQARLLEASTVLRHGKIGPEPYLLLEPGAGYHPAFCGFE